MSNSKPDASPDETLEDMAAGSLPSVPVQTALPIELSSLFAWHRPRKQRVRRGQWAQLSKQHLDRLEQKGQLASRQVTLNGLTHVEPAEVRYLTLPGLDFLDVRIIAEEVRQKGMTLTAVGFLGEAAQARHMARANVRHEGLIQAGWISDRSLTLPRPLESICGLNSDSLAQLRRQAPFHIVNIDACGSIAPRSALHSSRLIEAIHRLVELQIEQATHRWLFFLTIDVRDGDMDAATFDQICEAIRQNAAQSEDFKAAATELFEPGGDDFETAMTGARASQGRGVLDVFTLGFSKWLLHLAQAKQWIVKLKPSHCYATHGGHTAPPSMCSLAFEFMPPPPGLIDPNGASRLQPAPGGPVEDPSMQIVRAAAAIDDLDALFAGDDVLTAAMNTETHAMLVEAGYESEALASLLSDGTGTLRRYPDMPRDPA